MIVTVTLNPALDKVSVVRGFAVDSVGRVERSKLSPGGQGIHISRVLQSLGGHTMAMGLIGGAAGEFIRDRLDIMGVSNDFTFTRFETRTNLTILDPDSGTCTRIQETGEAVTAEDLQELWEKITQVARPGDTVVFAGQNPPGVADALLAEWITRLRADGIDTVLDTTGMAMKIGVAAGPTMIRAGRPELESLCEKELPDTAALTAAAATVAANGVERVVTPLEEAGALFVTADQRFRVHGLPVGSSRSASYALLAAILRGMEQQLDWEQTAQRAVAFSVAYARSKSGLPVTMEDALPLLDQLQVEQLT